MILLLICIERASRPLGFLHQTVVFLEEEKSPGGVCHRGPQQQLKEAEPCHCSEVSTSRLLLGDLEGPRSPASWCLPPTVVLPVVGVKPMSQGESGLPAHVVNFCPALKDLGISIPR